MVDSGTRVRFSPAPTGWLHVGGARTALFNWIFARQSGGRFLLRIEDTDVERSRPELSEAILDTLRWLGLDWDGDPVRQSDRVELHRDAVARLLGSGRAYRCDCSQDEARARAEARGGAPGYDGFCREREVEPGEGVVVRFRTPDEGQTSFEDVVRGAVSFDNANLEDFVIQRSSGAPMFIVANAVDDADMGVTHVIRGEDLLNATPKVLLLREALGVERRPVFAHLPMLVNERRQKLSKRRDDVAVGSYRDQGYLAEAMVNYLALLGWGPPDGVEIRPLDEIVKLFRLEDVNKAPAFFDLDKLNHINGAYLRSLSTSEFIGASGRFLEHGPWAPGDFDFEAFERMAPLVQERVTTLAEVPGMVDFLFLDEPEIDQASWNKALGGVGEADAVLDATIATYESCPWSAEELQVSLRAVGEGLGLSLRKAQAPVRVAVTGRSVGPPLFESLEVLGRERTLARLWAARRRLRG
ncbi:MAG: glutamate--tRNA ligase [Actinobacteria bacterium]|nr:glutamate--tRNA ligase [Actinomycetota bacterium]